MGGALILVGIIASTLLWGDLGNRYVWLVVIVTAAFGAVGWVDDYRKVVERIRADCRRAGNIFGNPWPGWVPPSICMRPLPRRLKQR